MATEKLATACPPEVKRAMWEASHYYVQMDEMMDGIGAQLAKLTGAEWGIVTNGAEAAIVLATIACIAGTDVEKWRDALNDPLAKLHLYGKTKIQPGRKMGHVTRLIPHR